MRKQVNGIQAQASKTKQVMENKSYILTGNWADDDFESDVEDVENQESELTKVEIPSVEIPIEDKSVSVKVVVKVSKPLPTKDSKATKTSKASNDKPNDGNVCFFGPGCKTPLQCGRKFHIEVCRMGPDCKFLAQGTCRNGYHHSKRMFKKK